MSLDAMKQALEALEDAVSAWRAEMEFRSCIDAAEPWAKAAESLRAAIEQAQPDELMIWKSRAMSAERIIEKFMQPGQEPVFELGFGWLDDATKYQSGTKLYATPPRQWQGLTDEELKDCEKQAMVNGALPFEQRSFFARAIEARLREKNT